MSLELESKKKSGFIAMLLNVVIPGAGYFYCKKRITGILIFAAAVAFVMNGKMQGVTVLCVIGAIDGFFAANRFNKKLLKAELDNLKDCPKCAEKIRATAVVCKHCKHELVSKEEQVA